MSDLIITHEQAKILSSATVPVAIRDPNGRLLGYASPEQSTTKQHGFSSEQIAEARRRADSQGPWHTTEQVLEHLRSLDTE